MDTPTPSHPLPTPPPLAAGMSAPPKLLDRVRQALQEQHVPTQRINAYVRSLADYILFRDLRHPRELGLEHITAFLAHVRRQPDATREAEVSARAALGFLYAELSQIGPLRSLGYHAKGCG